MSLLRDCLFCSVLVFLVYGDHRVLHLSIRRHRQMCIRARSSRRTLWNRLPQLDVAGALPSWAPGISIQNFQTLLLTTLHTDTASLIADLLRETDPLQTILAAVLRRHHDSAEFTTIVSADVAEHLKSCPLSTSDAAAEYRG